MCHGARNDRINGGPKKVSMTVETKARPASPRDASALQNLTRYHDRFTSEVT